jgi:hypothetical protein
LRSSARIEKNDAALEKIMFTKKCQDQGFCILLRVESLVESPAWDEVIELADDDVRYSRVCFQYG